MYYTRSILMRNTKQRECAWYGDITQRIEGREDWKLYICDHLWVLDMDGHYEFYFHPLHFLGKVEKKQLPEETLRYLRHRCKCFTAEDQKAGNRDHFYGHILKHSRYTLPELENMLRVGNWFYAQGESYVTMNGLFFKQVPYTNSLEECLMADLDWCMVEDMLRMVSSTKSHYYILNIWDLNCFRGVRPGSIRLKPLQETTWDSERWLTAYRNYTDDIKNYQSTSASTALRFMQKEVFQQTVFLVQNGFYHTESGKKVRLPDGSPMVAGSVLYSAKIPLKKESIYETTAFSVVNMDCLVAAQILQEEGYYPAVLNMANRQNPGGGVYNGAGAQEENLFRRTNLYLSLFPFGAYSEQYGLKQSAIQYPMDRNFGGAYSPNVTVFRGEEQCGYPLLEKPYQVGIISVAAMNRPEVDGHGNIAEHLVEGVKNKIRTILDIGIAHGHDSLVLGAFGCGAFRNPPAHIAKLFHEVIEQEYPGQFAKICFAILEDHNSKRPDSPEGNYTPFYREFID